MGLLDKYNLYNSEGKKMFTVIPGKELNTLLGMPQKKDTGISILS